MIGLPIPRLTATIQPPPNRHVLGVVTIYDPPPPVRPPTVALPARVKAVHHCSRCVAAGLNGAGHNSRSKHCPTMGCIIGGGPTGLDYHTAIDDPTLVRAATDSSISGDQDGSWARSMRELLSIALSKRPVEPGFNHPEEDNICQTIEDHREDAPAFFASIVMSNEPWRGDLIRLLARAPVKNTLPWGLTIAAIALNDVSADVRESAISAMEIWGGAEAKKTLESHRDPQGWLTEYAHRVAKEIG